MDNKTPVNREDLIEALKSLRIETETESKEVYTGGLDDSGRLYKIHTKIKLRLVADIDDQTYDISETEIDL